MRDCSPLGLTLGVADGKRVALDERELRRHVHVMGANTLAGQLSLEFLLAQQLQKGGGFLYVEEGERLASVRLEQLAKKLGAADFRRGLSIAAGLTESMRPSWAMTCSVQYMIKNKSATIIHLEDAVVGANRGAVEEILNAVAQALRDSLGVELQSESELIQDWGELRTPPRPFLIILPFSHMVVQGISAVLLAQARAFGISFILLDDRLNNGQHASVADEIADSIFTRLSYESGSAPMTYGFQVKSGRQKALSGHINFLPRGDRRSDNVVDVEFLRAIDIRFKEKIETADQGELVWIWRSQSLFSAVKDLIESLPQPIHLNTLHAALNFSYLVDAYRTEYVRSQMRGGQWAGTHSKLKRYLENLPGFNIDRILSGEDVDACTVEHHGYWGLQLVHLLSLEESSGGCIR